MLGRLTLILLISSSYIHKGLSWHDLTNVDYHCWPFSASEINPTSFPVCVGMDADWLIPPPNEVIENEPFTISFSLTLSEQFYTWAIQDANDNFKKNIFVYLNGTEIASDTTLAQHWCENQQCPASCSDAHQENCCLHHVNVHSCPINQVRFGLCPPWIPADGKFYTHSSVACGSALQRNWTAEISGLSLQDGQRTPTALIAHFKIATLHLALNWYITVVPRSVCGDGVCNSDDGEDCSVCPKDCEKCPISNGAIAGITVAGIIVLILLITGAVVLRIRSIALLTDESWIINKADIQPCDSQQQNAMMVSHMDIVEAAMNQQQINSDTSINLGMHNGMILALKTVFNPSFRLNNEIRQEVKQIRCLDHMNLVKFAGACIDSCPNLVILSEYYNKGNLETILQNKNIPISWAFRFSFANDIASGLNYLHSRGLFHGNLKTTKCLVDGRWTVKLVDYGLSIIKGLDSNLTKTEKIVRIHVTNRLSSFSEEKSLTSDVFNYGIILVQIATRNSVHHKKGITLAEFRREWLDGMRLIEGVVGDDRCPYPRQLAQLVAQCMKVEASARPPISAVKKQLRMLNPTKLGAVDLMMLMMEKYSKHLEQLVAERTTDLLAEKQRTDQLLYAMLPRQVADSLRLGVHVCADWYEQCTIYFSDIVGFTVIAGKCSAMDIVNLLNELYSRFDDVIDKHDVYKVETIGDAYMVVSGVPKRNGNQHAAEIANMAMDLLLSSSAFESPALMNDKLRIRIGLHTGSVCAGVVGRKMPRYCLFGDTVNTASRMESSGEAMRIHVSSACYELLVKNNQRIYHLEKRGCINVKGKGEMTTWWLNDGPVRKSTSSDPQESDENRGEFKVPGSTQP